MTDCNQINQYHLYKDQKGWTLVEMLVVISIFIVLGSIGVVGYQQAVRKSKNAKVESNIEVIKQALVIYRADKRKYPTNHQFPNKLVNENYLNEIPDLPNNLNYNYQAQPNGCNNAGGNVCTGFTLSAPYVDGGNYQVTNP